MALFVEKDRVFRFVQFFEARPLLLCSVLATLMKKNSLLLLISFLIGPCRPKHTTPVSHSPSPLAEARKAIAVSNQRYWQAFTTGDSTLFIERYATDACIMPANVPTLCGPQAAPTFYRVAYQQMGIRGGHFTTQAIWGGGQYVTEQGTFVLRDGRQALLGKGKYLVLWKKTSGG